MSVIVFKFEVGDRVTTEESYYNSLYEICQHCGKETNIGRKKVTKILHGKIKSRHYEDGIHPEPKTSYWIKFDSYRLGSERSEESLTLEE